MAERKAFSARVHGRVQGVGFRYSTRSQAKRLGVKGFVRNEPDGTVRVDCEGNPTAVDQMAAWLKEGPGMAHVTDVEFTWRETEQGYARFTVDG
ncbi:MAG: acylphosphatase [Spirochaetales bacterium]